MTTVTIADIGTDEVTIPVTDTSSIIVQTLSDGPPLGSYIADHSLCTNLDVGDPHPQYVLDTAYLNHVGDTSIHFTQAQISITTSQISDFATSGAISEVDAAELTSGTDTALHYHATDRLRSNHTGTQILETIITNNTIDAITENSTLKEFVDISISAGITRSDFVVTCDASGNVSANATDFLIRSTTDGNGTLYSAYIDASSGLTAADQTTTYLYIDYNAGDPVWATSTDPTDINMSDKIAAAVISRFGATAYVLPVGQDNVDANAKYRKKSFYTENIVRAAGGVLSNPTGLQIAVTAGNYWFGLSEFTHLALSGGGVFKYYYYNGSAWAVNSSATAISGTQYNNTASGLSTLSTRYYANHWVYAAIGNSTSEYNVVYGQAEYKSLAEAIDETPPTLIPDHLNQLGYLIGVVTVYENTGAIVSVRQFNGTHTASSTTSLIAINNPASSDPGTPGQVAVDSTGSYLYVCYAIDSWARVALTTGY